MVHYRIVDKAIQTNVTLNKPVHSDDLRARGLSRSFCSIILAVNLQIFACSLALKKLEDTRMNEILSLFLVR